MEQVPFCISIPVKCGESLSHVTFDGCDYIASRRCCCEIIRFNLCRGVCERYCTCREYDCICYDWGEGCFWASSKEYTSKIYKLDETMREIDCISVYAFSRYGAITGISYDCGTDSLLVSLSSAVLQLEKRSEQIQLCYTANGCCIVDVLSISPGMLLTIYRGDRYEIEVLDGCGCKTRSCRIDFPYIPKNLILKPCISSCEEPQIWAFALKKNRYPYLCPCNLTLDDLRFLPCCCNFRECEPCCCEGSCCCDSTNDIIESIALIEAALSHILNAEGEKIQKVLAQTDDIDQILCTNREVNRTIENVTQLEYLLCRKLSTVIEQEPCCPDHPEGDDGCCPDWEL